MSALFLCAWEKKGMSSRVGGGASERYCSRERDNGRQEKEHIHPCLLWCITSILSRGKNGHGHWWMASLTGEEQSRVSPERLRRENGYFLAKWFWLELHLNLDWGGNLNQNSNGFSVTELVESCRLQTFNSLIWLHCVIHPDFTLKGEFNSLKNDLICFSCWEKDWYHSYVSMKYEATASIRLAFLSIKTENKGKRLLL